MDTIIWLVILELCVFIQGIQSISEPGEKIGFEVPVGPHFTCKATEYRYLNLSKTIDYSRTYEDRMKIRYKIGLPYWLLGYAKLQIGPGVGLASAIRELPLNMMFSAYALHLLEQSLFQMTSAVLEEDSMIWTDSSRLLLSHGNNYATEARSSVGLIMKRGSKLNIFLSSFVDIESGTASGLFMDVLSILKVTSTSKVLGGALVLMEKSKLCLDEQASIKIPNNGVLLLFPNVSMTRENGKLIMRPDEDSKSDEKLFCFIFKDLYLNERIYISSTTVDDSIICTNNPTEAYLKSLGNETDNQQREDKKATVRRLVNSLPPFEASFEHPNIPKTDEWKSCSK